ncbi:MAG: ion transporter [Elusimicrobia bacterium]|nr:ion transporter [Elusimicrobiota bacterium]
MRTGLEAGGGGRAVAAIVGSRAFKVAVLSLIVVNAALIGLDTYPAVSLRFGGLINALDRAILAVFTLEIGLRFLAAPSGRAFFSDHWQWLDIVVVAGGYVPATSFLTVFRLLRVLRILHSIVYMPSLQRIVGALLNTLPSLANVIAMLAIIFYIYGTLGTILFGGIAPEHFGSLHLSLLSLFEVMTLEGWASMMRQVMTRSPHAWVYFVSFILVGTFFALNAVISVLISNLGFLVEDTDLARVEASLKRIEERLDKLEV